MPFRKGAGEIQANLAMKAVTKAKRRVTLSICGLGFMDETEVADVPEATTEQPLPSNIVEPHEIPLMQSHGSIDWRAFGTALADRLRRCETKTDVFEWLEVNRELITRMANAVPQMHGKLQETIEQIKAEPT